MSPVRHLMMEMRRSRKMLTVGDRRLKYDAYHRMDEARLKTRSKKASGWCMQ